MQPRILVPIDFSDSAQQALAWAGDLHRSVGGGAVKLLHVITIPSLASDLRAAVVMTPSAEELVKLHISLGELIARQVPDGQIEIVTATDVGPAIVEAAGQWPADLIVLGTHGRGALGRLVFGSVAAYVTTHASCPVTTMRAPHE
jgi:nucleotide-binding universal stress UspA family protein